MSIYAILAGFLHPMPPSAFTVTDGENGGTVTKVGVSLQGDARLHLDFEYTTPQGQSHILLGTVDHQGNATISYDGDAAVTKPLIHAGTALHFEPLPTPYVIVKWSFQSGDQQKLIRFEGKHAL